MIRNYNEAEALKKCLASVTMQVTRAAVEIVLLDNESTDDSVAVAQSFGSKVFTLPKQEFTYGRALNQGIAHCTGECILLLSSHVVLLTPHFIEDFLKYLEDETVAGMRFCIASSQKMILDEPKPRRLSYKHLQAAPDKQMVLNNWMAYIVANCSVIRKSCWQLQPFDEEIIASEDKIWSVAILQKGYDLLYNAPCYYAYFKEMTARQQSEKYLIESKVLHQVGGIGQKSFLQIVKGSFRILAGNIKKGILASSRQFRNDLKLKKEIKNANQQP